MDPGICQARWPRCHLRAEGAQLWRQEQHRSPRREWVLHWLSPPRTELAAPTDPATPDSDADATSFSSPLALTESDAVDVVSTPTPSPQQVVARGTVLSGRQWHWAAWSDDTLAVRGPARHPLLCSSPRTGGSGCCPRRGVSSAQCPPPSSPTSEPPLGFCRVLFLYFSAGIELRALHSGPALTTEPPPGPVQPLPCPAEANPTLL